MKKTVAVIGIFDAGKALALWLFCNCVKRPAAFLLVRMIPCVVVVSLVLFIGWRIFDKNYLYTERFQGCGQSPTNHDLTIIRTNLEFCIGNLAGPSIGERNVYRAKNLSMATKWIIKRFEYYGYSYSNIFLNDFTVPSSYRFDATQIEPFATNIVVEKRGTHSPEEIVIIGAHYDTVGFSKDWTGDDTNQFRLNHPGTPGANDNASGVAALLEIARLLKTSELPRTVRFVAFANEEPPFFQEKDAMGSYLYAQRCRANAEKIIVMVSLDTLGVYSRGDDNLKRAWPASWFLPMLGLSPDTNYVAFMSNWDANSGPQAAFWAKVFSTNSLVPVRTASLPFIARFGKEIFAWSDDWSFTRQSYPAFAVTDTAFYRSDRYHELADSHNNLTAHDYEVLAKVVSGLSSMTEIMCK